MKKILVFLLIASILLILCSCGSKKPAQNVETEATEESSSGSREEIIEEVIFSDVIDNDFDMPMDRPTGAADESTTEPEKTGGIGSNLQTHVIDIINTGQYTMTMSSGKGGMKVSYKGVISGENTSQEMTMMGLTIKLVSNNGKCYLVSDKGKKYAEISFEEFNKQLETIKNYSLEFKDLSLTATQKVSRGDKEYIVENYVDSKGENSRYYFRNDALELLIIGKGDKTEERAYTITPMTEAPGMAIPSDYVLATDAASILLGT